MAGTGSGLRRLLELHHQPIRPRSVRLVDGEQVGDLHQAGLHRLDRVPGLGHQQHEHRVRQVHDLQLGLSHPHGLQDHPIVAGCTHELEHVIGGPREPALVSATAQGSDEDPLVGRVPLHPDPVAENGAATEGAGRVHQQHGHALVAAPEPLEQAVHQRALPGPRWAGDPKDVGRRVRLGLDPVQQIEHPRCAILDRADQASQVPLASAEGAVEEDREVAFHRPQGTRIDPGGRSAL